MAHPEKMGIIHIDMTVPRSNRGPHGTFDAYGYLGAKAGTNGHVLINNIKNIENLDRIAKAWKMID